MSQTKGPCASNKPPLITEKDLNVQVRKLGIGYYHVAIRGSQDGRSIVHQLNSNAHLEQ